MSAKSETKQFDADVAGVNAQHGPGGDNQLFNETAADERKKVVSGEETAEQAEENVNRRLDDAEGLNPGLCG
jgi:hypothetical protein